MSELTEQPTTDQPFRRIAALRAGVWLVVAIAAALHSSSSPWAFRGALAGLLYAAITASVPYPRATRPARLFDLFVDLLATLSVVCATGGPTSPYSPLLFLVCLEAHALQGAAVASGLALLSTTASLVSTGAVTTASLLSYAVLNLALLVEVGLLRALGLPKPLRTTLLPERTAEDLERLLDTVEEQNRKLRQTHRDMTTAVRQAQAGAEEAAARYRLLAAGLQESDVDSAFRSVLDILREEFEADAGAIWIADSRSARLELRAWAGPISPVIQSDPPAIEPNSQPSDVRKVVEQRLRGAVPEPNPESKAVVDKKEIVDDTQSRPDVIATALRESDRVIGAVALACSRTDRFSPEDAGRLASLAVATALAIRTIEQRGSLQRGLQEISILHDMNLLVQNTADLDQIYDQIAELVAKVIPFENCTIFRFDAERKQLEPVVTRGRLINLLEHVPFEHGTGVSAYVAASRKQLFIPDITREPGVLKAELIPPRVRSFVSVPMIVRDNLVGVINVSHSQAGAFTRDEARVLGLLAGQAAMTIEREEMVRSLEQLAITDGLTGVFNHRYFQMRLENEVKRAQRYRLPFALLMIDLDHFKSINDRYGHATGDLVLSHVANLLRVSLRETDITARYGGEEFAVVLTQTMLADAERTAERLRKSVAEAVIEGPDGLRLQATVSIGVASYPEHGDTREALLQAADGALYAAKSDGRNRVQIA